MTLHSLTDKQRQRLKALQLYLNEPEPVLICRPCGYALKLFGERVSRHLAEKHDVLKTQRRGLSALVKSLYRTASDDLVCCYLSKAYGIKDSRKADGWQRDQIHSGVLLQSWLQNTHDAERAHLASGLRATATATATGPVDMAF
ncbi:hypothetical protein CSHISOI_10930 [Colletotrichum shisoi]|uniref:Uncharacterized protein n=1 Tax=Colletotrichum shisoi TaxID=2078593 RepID=A0A5Q4BCP0_9PEZI|nr:hypothetical protein CSHISOI_10930 [Colletotrichum shisoi]